MSGKNCISVTKLIIPLSGLGLLKMNPNNQLPQLLKICLLLFSSCIDWFDMIYSLLSTDFDWSFRMVSELMICIWSHKSFGASDFEAFLEQIASFEWQNSVTDEHLCRKLFFLLFIIIHFSWFSSYIIVS